MRDARYYQGRAEFAEHALREAERVREVCRVDGDLAGVAWWDARAVYWTGKLEAAREKLARVA